MVQVETESGTVTCSVITEPDSLVKVLVTVLEELVGTLIVTVLTLPLELVVVIIS